MKKQAAVGSNSRISQRAKSSCKQQRERTLAGYFQVVKYLLEMYVMYDLIAEKDAEILRFIQMENRTPIVYAKLFWAKVGAAFTCSTST